MEKFAFVFTIYIIGCIVSLITFAIENIYKNFSHKTKTQHVPSMHLQKVEALNRKIEDFRDDINRFLEDNALHQKDNILLTTEQVEQIEQINEKLFNLKQMA